MKEAKPNCISATNTFHVMHTPRWCVRVSRLFISDRITRLPPRVFSSSILFLSKRHAGWSKTSHKQSHAMRTKWVCTKPAYDKLKLSTKKWLEVVKMIASLTSLFYFCASLPLQVGCTKAQLHTDTTYSDFDHSLLSVLTPSCAQAVMQSCLVNCKQHLSETKLRATFLGLKSELMQVSNVGTNLHD